MAFNHFAAAKTVEAPKKSKKSDKPRVAIEGMSMLADLDTAIANLMALKAVVEADVKEAMTSHFVEEGATAKARPENFEGFEGTATGSCQLKIRSSSSALSDEDVTLLTKADLPFDTNVEQEAMFAFNASYTKDQRVIKALATAIGKIKIDGEPLPEDLIVALPERSKRTATTETIKKLFETGDRTKIRAVLPTITTLAVNVKGNPNSVAAFASVMEHLNDNQTEQEAA